jgi:hypothetical protein
LSLENERLTFNLCLIVERKRDFLRKVDKKSRKC